MDLEKIAPIIEGIIKASLEEKRYAYGFANNKGLSNKVASGRLRNSVRAEVITQPDHNAIIQIYMEEYYQWVQSGRLPGKKGVPVGALLQWIKDRKLRGRKKNGKFMSNLSFAFAISKNINKFGIRPANFLDISFEKIMEDPQIIELVGEAGFEELINAIQGI
jgi:hypothetical protein